MFQPHSVRGLLSRRNQTRLHSEEQLEYLPAGGDSDFDSMVETKLIIKDVEHTIDDIRQWRDHQRSLLEQKLASNEAVAKVTINEYLSHLDRQEKHEDEERQKILNKLLIEEPHEEITSKEWNNSDTNLFEYLTNSNRLVDQRKYELQNQDQQNTPNDQAFMNDLEALSGTILRREEGKRVEGSPMTGVANRAMIKKELQEIDDELKEIEELLKD